MYFTFYFIGGIFTSEAGCVLHLNFPHKQGGSSSAAELPAVVYRGMTIPLHYLMKRCEHRRKM